MTDRSTLDEHAIRAWLAGHEGWAYEGGALRKSYAFGSYGEGVSFVVRVGFAAERRDHHPDLWLGYRRVDLAWSTHDAGGVTALDLEAAAESDALGPAR